MVPLLNPQLSIPVTMICTPSSCPLLAPPPPLSLCHFLSFLSLSTFPSSIFSLPFRILERERRRGRVREGGTSGREKRVELVALSCHFTQFISIYSPQFYPPSLYQLNVLFFISHLTHSFPAFLVLYRDGHGFSSSGYRGGGHGVIPTLSLVTPPPPHHYDYYYYCH